MLKAESQDKAESGAPDAQAGPALDPATLNPVMTEPRPYLLRMIGFVIAVLLLSVALHAQLAFAFTANPFLNGVIVAVLLVGIAYAFRQVLMLRAEVTWVEEFRQAELESEAGDGGGEEGEGEQEDPADQPPPPARPQPLAHPVLLAPMAVMLRERQGLLSLSALSTRSMLDTIGSRLDESRDISRYLIGLLIFLGLLGTFWGLLDTVSSVGNTIKNLSVAGGDFGALFDDLKSGLAAPLSGMGTAFSSSLFGLAGSLVLGFLDLQAGQAQNRFYNDLEEWLSTRTRLSSGSFDGDQGAPAYITALLEQTADSLENLQRIFLRSEESRSSTGSTLMSLAERLATLSDHLHGQQGAIEAATLERAALQPHIEKLGQAIEALTAAQKGAGLDDASRTHLRNLDLHLARLIEETAAGRDRMVSELRNEIKLLTRTIAGMPPQRR